MISLRRQGQLRGGGLTMYIKRSMEPVLKAAMKKFLVVTVVGSRQSGKTLPAGARPITPRSKKSEAAFRPRVMRSI